MKWTKILLTVLGGSVAGSIGGWGANYASPNHQPLTTGTILIPAAASAVAALAALFVKPPKGE